MESRKSLSGAMAVVLVLMLLLACNLPTPPTPASPSPAPKGEPTETEPSLKAPEEAPRFHMVSPPDGVPLGRDPIEFEWEGDCDDYRLTISQVKYGAGEIYDSQPTTDFGREVEDLPWNGQPLYVTLWCEGDTAYQEYTYTAPFFETIVDPIPGSHLDASTVKFTWTGRSEAAEYCLSIGSSPEEDDLGRECTTTADYLKFSGLPEDGSEVYVRLWYQQTPESCTMFEDCPYTDVAEEPPGQPYIAYLPGWDRSDIVLAQVTMADTAHVTTQDEVSSLALAEVEQGATVRFWVTLLLDHSHAAGGRVTLSPEEVSLRAVLEYVAGAEDYYVIYDRDSMLVRLDYGPDSPYRGAYPLPALTMDGTAISGLDEAGFAGTDSLPLDGVALGDLDEMTGADILYTDPLPGLSPARAAEIRDQLGLIGFVQQVLNNHAGAVPEAALQVSDGPLASADYLMFTVSVNTEGLMPGLWRLGLSADPDNEIEEYDEGNNGYVADPVFRLINDPQAGQTVFDDGDLEHRRVNPCPDYVVGSELPTLFATELHKWWTSHWPRDDEEHPLYTDFTGGLTFLQRSKMRTSEILGPEGTGLFWSDEVGDWVPYYPEPEDAPEESEIRNVFFFAVGQSACGAANLTGITKTTYDLDGDDKECEFPHGLEQMVRVRQTSYAGQILHWEPYFAQQGIYSRDDTLLVVVPAHRMTLWSLQWHEGGYFLPRHLLVGSLFRYLAQRTNNFEKVEHIVLGGKSRGGHLVTYLANMIKQLRETPNQVCTYQHGICVFADAYTGSDPEYLSGLKFQENNPRLTVVTVEPSGYPLTDLGHDRGTWCVVPQLEAGLHRLDNGDVNVPVAWWDLEEVFPVGSPPYGDYTENLAFLNVSGNGWVGDDWRIPAGWLAATLPSGYVAAPSISVVPAADRGADGRLLEAEDALAGGFYSHWNVPGYSHFEVDSIWMRKNGIDVFNWIMEKTYDARQELEEELPCALCIASRLSGNDRFQTGSAKRFNSTARAYAQRFTGPGDVEKEGYLQEVKIALGLPGGERVQAAIYADDDLLSGGNPLAVSEIVRLEAPPGHASLSYEFALPFAYEQQVMLDPREYYWLVVEFLDIDASSTTNRGTLYYFEDPGNTETEAEWRMAIKRWDVGAQDWRWDAEADSDDGVLRFSVHYCQRQVPSCQGARWSASYFDRQLAGFQWELGEEPVAQRFVAGESGPVQFLRIYLAQLDATETVEVCLHRDARWEPGDEIACAVRGDASAGSARQPIDFYFHVRDERPYLQAGTPYWISTRMLDGAAQLEYYDVNYQEMDYEDNWFIHWGTDDYGVTRWIHHAGGENNKDMAFGVYVCGD